MIDELVPMAFVASVARSVEFYRLLGFEVRNEIGDTWASLQSHGARLMVSRASDPVDPTQQAILFYLYTKDVAALREELMRRGVTVGAIEHPDYMPKGEVRIEDPDGYVLLVGQPD